jgi:endonuclease YncB( thermonuclease family)
MLNPEKGAYRRLFLLLGGLLFSAAVAGADCPTDHFDEFARVRYVHDGDTVHLDDGRKVRLIGINTPELARDNRPEQAYAQQARTFLIGVLSSYENRIALVYGKERHDRHQRTLAHLFSPGGENIQALLLQQGLAAAITHPPSVSYAECYTRQETFARCAHSGIWSDPQYAVTPANKLTAKNTGFQRVSGDIDHVIQSDGGVWLFMSELKMRISDEDLAYFDPIDLPSLVGQHVTVRGWLQRARKIPSNKRSHGRGAKYYLRIRHPNAIEINKEGGETKC